MSILGPDLLRHNEVLRQRSVIVRRAIIGSVIQYQMFFWAWVVGWQLGPTSLRPVEIGVGIVFALALGVVLAWPFLRRHVEHACRWSTHLREGRRRFRWVFYDDYLTIGQEIVLRSTIQLAESEGSDLRFEYRGAVDGALFVRHFTGTEEVADRVRKEVESPLNASAN